jgi:hypothetical protein
MQSKNGREKVNLFPTETNQQKSNMKTLTAIACAVALLGSLTIARAEDSCCDKAKAAGKECTHKCCVEAKKDGKTCEKCNPKKEEKK